MRERGYYYYERFKVGADYPIVARRKGSMKASEQILLDQPKMAKGHGFFAVSDYSVSQDNRLLAYAEDVVGRRQYKLKVKDLGAGKALPDVIENVEANLVWADDNRTIYYIEKDPVTLLSKRVKAHVLGTAVASDRLIYEEKDDSFQWASAAPSTSRSSAFSSRARSARARCTSAAARRVHADRAARARFLYGRTMSAIIG